MGLCPQRRAARTLGAVTPRAAAFIALHRSPPSGTEGITDGGRAAVRGEMGWASMRGASREEGSGARDRALRGGGVRGKPRERVKAGAQGTRDETGTCRGGIGGTSGGKGETKGALWWCVRAPAGTPGKGGHAARQWREWRNAQQLAGHGEGAPSGSKIPWALYVAGPTAVEAARPPLACAPPSGTHGCPPNQHPRHAPSSSGFRVDDGRVEFRILHSCTAGERGAAKAAVEARGGPGRVQAGPTVPPRPSNDERRGKAAQVMTN